MKRRLFIYFIAAAATILPLMLLGCFGGPAMNDSGRPPAPPPPAAGSHEGESTSVGPTQSGYLNFALVTSKNVSFAANAIGGFAIVVLLYRGRLVRCVLKKVIAAIELLDVEKPEVAEPVKEKIRWKVGPDPAFDRMVQKVAYKVRNGDSP